MAARRLEPTLPFDRTTFPYTRQVFGIDATLCFAASQSNYFEALRALWGGASPDAVFLNDSALNMACSFACFEIAELLLDRGASVDGVAEQVPRQDAVDGGATEDGEPTTSLFCACSGGCPRILRLLLERGASIDRSSGSRSHTPLFFAIHNNLLEITSILLEFGANIHLVNNLGHSALVTACFDSTKDIPDRGVDMVRLLLDRGAEINQGDISALCVACSRDNIPLTRLLLARGALCDDRATILCARHFGSRNLNSLMVRFFIAKWKLLYKLRAITLKTTTQCRVFSDSELMHHLTTFLIGDWIW